VLYHDLQYLWEFGPDLVPYDTVHLPLLNVVPRLWELFSRENEQLGDDQPCVISKEIRKTIRREIKTG